LKEKADQKSLSMAKRDNIELVEGEVIKPKREDDQEEVLIKTTGVSAPVEPKEEEAQPEKAPLKKEEPAEEPAEAEAPEQKAPEKAEKEAAEEREKAKLPGAKVVGKIELEKKKAAVEGAAEPAKEKAAKKEDPAKEEEKAPEPEKKEEKAEKEEPVARKTKKAGKEEPELKKTEKIKLDGPKVLGKIELPKEEEKKKGKKDQESREKKKRRRRRVKKRIDPEGLRGDRKGRRQRKGEGKTEVSEKEIQEQIKATLAKLSTTSGKGKSSRVRHKREKRQEQRKQEEQLAQEQEKVLQVTEFISVSELANMLDVSPTDVISKCMDLGVIVSINQRLDAEIIELVVSEYGYEVKFIEVSEQEDLEPQEEEDAPEDLKGRAPIVTIMGHVDHGKTSLLDYIRESRVVAGEVGGITQHIGAYEVTTENSKQITFLDTPGHEAFTAMRARGAKITDVAVIVIAADDSVMPQTKEAISHAKAAGVPMIFAINKMDKEGANADKIKEQLANMDLLVEDWGGKFQSQEISAKQGTNVDELLDKILLEAEMLELKANPDRLSSGSIIEATLDKGRGYVATILVQNGTLRMGDIVLAGTHYGKVKAMFDERGHKVKEAGPATPVLLLGLNGAPQAGELFKVMESEQEAKQIANKRAQILREQGLRTQKHITLDEIGRRLALGTFKELNVIIKADVDGSIEALADALLQLSTAEIQVNVVHRAVGQITESDVLLASASDAIIIGFQVRPSLGARKLAEKENIEIRLYSIIYDAIEEVKSAMEGMLEPKIEEEIMANVEVRETFKVSKVGTIAGCYVMDGKVNRNAKVRLIREGIVTYDGEIDTLKRYKDDVKEVSVGMECGIKIKNYDDVKVGDMIEAYKEVEVQRKL